MGVAQAFGQQSARSFTYASLNGLTAGKQGQFNRQRHVVPAILPSRNGTTRGGNLHFPSVFRHSERNS